MRIDDPNRIIQLERDLRELIKLWERFFAGDIRLPPTRERNAMQRRLRLLSDQPPRRSSDRFRLDQLQHRFMAYAMNWERILREREEGVHRYVPGKIPETVAAPAPSRRTRTNEMPTRSVDENGADALFARWKSAKESIGQNVGVRRNAFAAQIEAQRKQLEKKFGQAVDFDVKVESGKVKLTAKRRDESANGEN